MWSLKIKNFQKKKNNNRNTKSSNFFLQTLHDETLNNTNASENADFA